MGVRTATAVGLLALVAAAATWLAMRDRDAPTAQPDAGPAAAAARPPTTSAPGLAGAPALAARPRAVAGRTPEGDAASPTPDAPAPGSAATILVTVQNPQGAPIPRATVRARGVSDGAVRATATSDADGRATFFGVERGDVVVEAFADGYCPRAREPRDAHNFEWSSGPGREIVELDPGIAVPVRVVDDATETPVGGATVTLIHWGDAVDVGATAEDGTLRLPGLRDDDETDLRVAASGYATTIVTVRVDGGAPSPGPPVVRLARGGSLTGVVHAADGTPVAGATVVAVPEEQGSDLVVMVHDGDQVGPEDEASLVRRLEYGDEFFTTFAGRLDRGRENSHGGTTAADGTFRFDGLVADGAYTLRASAVGHADAAPVAGVRPLAGSARTGGVVLTLRAAAVVLVRVTGAEGSALPPDVRVRVVADDRLFLPDDAEPDGRFRFRSVGRGRAYAFAHADGFRSALKALDVTEGARLDVELRLDAGGTVQGIVVDAAGTPLYGAEVSVGAASEQSPMGSRYLAGARKAETDVAGRFVVAGLPPGPAVLVASWMSFPTREGFGTPRRMELTVPARDVRVVLVRRGGARLRLLTADGKPFADEVFAWFIGETGGSGGSDTPEDGVMRRWDQEDGTYVWTLRPRGFAWIRRTVVIQDGATVDLGDVVVEPGVDVTGRVLDAAGRPVANARVNCPETEGDRWALTGPDGRFVIKGFPRERFTLVVEADGFCTVPVTVEPGRTEGMEVRLARHVTVRGRVRAEGRVARVDGLDFRPDGERAVPGSPAPTEGPWRPFTTEAAGPTWTTVSDDGTFEVALTPGRWVAFLEAEDGTETVVGTWTFAEGTAPTIEVTVPAAAPK